jgi:SAM-dependent methyltransferase
LDLAQEARLNKESWEYLSSKLEPSWYLDPITAKQKREIHLKLIAKWSEGMQVQSILKTDLFEEAFGDDSLLDALFPNARLVCGMDAAFPAARKALQRHGQMIRAMTCDIRSLAVQDCSVDIVVSTSTLDHFDGRADYLCALSELARVLKPGGLLIVTLDNPWNLLYYPLRWFSSCKMSPFPLGYTEAMPQLEKDLTAAGLRAERSDWILHNPRGISTLLFLGFRKLFPRRLADTMIHLSLFVFELLNGLPTRKITACFVAVAARKPVVTSK